MLMFSNAAKTLSFTSNVRVKMLWPASVCLRQRKQNYLCVSVGSAALPGIEKGFESNAALRFSLYMAARRLQGTIEGRMGEDGVADLTSFDY
jgi:hypothetical protein